MRRLRHYFATVLLASLILFLCFAIKYDHIFASKSRLDEGTLIAKESGERVRIATQQTSYQNEPWARKLYGTIWPLSDNDTTDRIQSQLNYMRTYKAWKQRHGGFTKLKEILGFGNFPIPGFDEGRSIFSKCPISHCVATRNTSAAMTADAVLFIRYGLKGEKIFPGPKPAHQIWIALHWERPSYPAIDTQALRQLINWTANYRRDSTIPFRYGSYETVPNGTHDETINYAVNKTKMVSMLVSNCVTNTTKRLSYARELSKHIQVDIYGKCGSLKCPDQVSSRKDCMGWISERYKFYLAFENSNCKDYIMEKFVANGLGQNLLPIVMGASREEYSTVAPPHSYLHVDDFESPRHLAKFLHQLDKDDVLYNSYFAWKGTMRLKTDERFNCRMCMMLHLQEDVGYVHAYSDYHHWWNDVCRV